MRPVKNKIYKNESQDSTKWDQITLRESDIIIATAPKVGATWMERILSLLIHKDPERLDSEVMNAPWPEANVFGSFDEMLDKIESIQHRRFFKTHIPLDGLDYDPKVKYIHVSRDTRDAFMSIINHWSLISDFLVKHNRSHPPLFETQGDIHKMWLDYTSKSIFEWEKDGWPYWSNNAYTDSFWDFKELPNILFVHNKDLLLDLKGQIKRISKFLDIDDIDEALFDRITEKATFDSMKKDGEKLLPKYDKVFKGGAKAFIFKGKNGRWKDWFSDEDERLYKDMNSRYRPEIIDWIENGTTIN